ncbi:maleylacetoacetate isomerase [Steroidobacter agaridevorans]|uniref:Maleylacetoacetate isomerase n=1 Tax=Steroidobacter agaridevorans TaxID=2695856 RepID=A0A829Y791_9GAMM|nr:maleylacetoacetate isomerase [Steroidobacter agaridevorans]GFE78903.1 maleylacetoacetate isomerase [Steroidobacter agaridevorans]GFE88056.1 maleylacetoacetate isomerase [Steroidobacter agaridevorans]
MKLYNYFRSSAAFRVRIALNLKGLEYEYVSKALLKNEHRAADYLALNPEGLIPALAVDDTVITQSLAIVEYLDEVHPQPPLLPADPLARAQVRSMALAIACDIHPLNNLRVLNHVRRLGQNDDGVNAWYRHWVSEGFRGLEQQVAKHSSARRYCFGDSLSLADVCLAPQMYNARRFDCDLTPFPTLVAVSTHLETLPAFDAARPEVQPDAR